MAKQNTFVEEFRDEGRINARIIDPHAGLTVLNGVYAIRIHSKYFNALILNDYLPTIGKIEGNISLLYKEGEVHYDRIFGFYKLQHNEFTLLLEEYDGSSEAAK